MARAADVEKIAATGKEARPFMDAFAAQYNAMCTLSSSATRSLWVITIAFALPIGVYSGWGAVLAINLKEAGIGATEAGLVSRTIYISN